MDIVQKIKYLCDREGITFAELERRINLSNGQIAKWRKQIPGINKVQLVADYFDVSVDYLLGRKTDGYAGEIGAAPVLMFKDQQSFNDLSKEEQDHLLKILTEQGDFMINQFNKNKH